MKNNTLRKSGLGLLMLAGTLFPLASSIAEESRHDSYGAQGMDAFHQTGEGKMYDDLSRIQAAASWSSTERGAQGPVRTEGMDVNWSSGEDKFYSDVRAIQSAKWSDSTERGAKGPIRSEGMETYLSNSESKLYDDLRKVQSSH